MIEKTALILIDVQEGFHEAYWGKRNNPNFEENTSKLIAKGRMKGWKLFFIRHDSLNPRSPLRKDYAGNDFMEIARPIEGDEILSKTVNSAFIGTRLEEKLRSEDIQKLVIAGLTTDHCVSTTVRMAANLGFEVRLVVDAIATFDRADMNGTQISADEIQRIHLASLNGEFAELVTVEKV